MKDFFLACRQTTKFFTSCYHHFGCAQTGMPKLPKIGNLRIFAISLEKHWR